MKHGFIRVAAAIPEIRVADCKFNGSKIIELIEQAEREQVELICFPELAITGYSCADLFLQQQLLSDAIAALNEILLKTYSLNLIGIVGMPMRIQNRLYNVAVVFQSGKILGIVPKCYLPNHHACSEKRWFTAGTTDKVEIVHACNSHVPFATNLLFSYQDIVFGVEIGEDLWGPLPPSTQHCLHGAELICNPSAANELIGKYQYLNRLIEQQSAKCNAAYVYASAGFGESSTDVVHAGNGIIAENGKTIALTERFSFQAQLIISEIDTEILKAERLRDANFYQAKSDAIYQTIPCKSSILSFEHLFRKFDKYPFIPAIIDRDTYCREAFSIQVSGLAKRWKHTQAKTLIVGISGGLDSTLALLVCIKAADQLGYDRKTVTGITMPGFGTTGRTYRNAVDLMQSLGITIYDIPIKDACMQHFKDINHDINQHDITYENTQARERTQILMDMANKTGGLVVGTGDLSELALGWTTYNGDHMSMYAVNSSIPKTFVKHIIEWASLELSNSSEVILKDILNTPVSPELLPADNNDRIVQKTEDLVGPYELHDFFLYYFIRFGFSPDKIFFLACQTFKDIYSGEIIAKWLKIFLKRFYTQQFKRSCMPDGPKVGSISLSPHGDWQMPSDAVAPDWDYKL